MIGRWWHGLWQTLAAGPEQYPFYYYGQRISKACELKTYAPLTVAGSQRCVVPFDATGAWNSAATTKVPKVPSRSQAFWSVRASLKEASSDGINHARTFVHTAMPFFLPRRISRPWDQLCCSYDAQGKVSAKTLKAYPNSVLCGLSYQMGSEYLIWSATTSYTSAPCSGDNVGRIWAGAPHQVRTRGRSGFDELHRCRDRISLKLGCGQSVAAGLHKHLEAKLIMTNSMA